MGLSNVSLVSLDVSIFGSGHEVAGTKGEWGVRGGMSMGPPADQYLGQGAGSSWLYWGVHS